MEQINNAYFLKNNNLQPVNGYLIFDGDSYRYMELIDTIFQSDSCAFSFINGFVKYQFICMYL